jgi:hypothetical protein
MARGGAAKRWGLILGLVALAAIAGARLVARPKAPEAPAVASRPIRVEVLNGCGVPGAAERVATVLREGRFLVERIGNAPEFGHTENLVIARTADREAMEEVARRLDCPNRLVQRNEAADVDVTVIVGRPR